MHTYTLILPLVLVTSHRGLSILGAQHMPILRTPGGELRSTPLRIQIQMTLSSASRTILGLSEFSEHCQSISGGVVGALNGHESWAAGWNASTSQGE